MGIDDWYLARAHRHEVMPEYGPDDDIPDPEVFGESPAQGWIVHGSGQRLRHKKRVPAPDGPRTVPSAVSGGTWQSAARKWLAAFPQGTNRECLRALRSAGHKNATTQLIERLRVKSRTDPARAKKHVRRSTSGNKRRRSADDVAWHGFAVQWLRTHPGASNRQWREAVEEAGFAGVSSAAIAALRGEVRSRKAKPLNPSTARPTPLHVKVDYCDGCGIAVRDDGLCRC
ncbi:hypothetical protein ACFQ05_34715 [Amycolatopsis umgeniensis]|uniref:Uncharacterized protein n=1 Tax=Amycolatopsis umgeniensis TaxID=336628 RepID=A0A841BAJ3_9PSEU|nr:hypothetical protein [Amycolatopsis umgeniensis]MBB5855893.1 hypothetical protein [Amycolatopsis umgeniensis]